MSEPLQGRGRLQAAGQQHTPVTARQRTTYVLGARHTHENVCHRTWGVCALVRCACPVHAGETCALVVGGASRNCGDAASEEAEFSLAGAIGAGGASARGSRSAKLTQ